MLKSFKYRLYPTSAQEELINKHIGGARFVYNLALETKIMAYYSNNRVNLSCYDLNKQLPPLKKDCDWLKEVNSQTLAASIRNLDNAYNRFFKGLGDFPKYKSKKGSKNSFHIPQSVSVNIKKGKLSIPKFREGININLHREIKGIIKSATISRTPTGKFYVSILCETGEECMPKAPINKKTTIGIDLGIKDFIVTSDGVVVDNPKYLRKAESKLKYIQRKYSKNKGKRTKNKLAKLHEKVANQRRDFLNKESFKLVSENQTIAIEDLNIKGMLKNHRLAKSISDVGWSMFINMLEYKAEWYGVNLLRIGRFEPSSKTCSNCNDINEELTLNDREWICVKCNTQHDRDLNAAINIKNFALKNMVPGVGTKIQNELPALVGVMTSETQSIAIGVDG